MTAGAVTGTPNPRPPRLLSLDALRGFDMFWIVGAEGLVHALAKASGGTGVSGALARQLSHKPWEGFAFYDLIFPLFVFIVGVSIALSMNKVRAGVPASEARRKAWGRIVRRGLLLVVIGVFYYGGIAQGWDQIRWLGVLQRIGICYTVTAILYCTLRPRALAGVCVALLLGTWAVMALVPVRDIALTRSHLNELSQASGGATPEELYARTTTWVRGVYDPGRNVANHLDFRWLPGRRWNGAYDPEGILSTVPAIASCLLGVFAGLLLQRNDWTDRRKVQTLSIAGGAGVALGFTWGLVFPVVKQLWTSSFVLVAGGFSCLLLAAFFQIIDVSGRQRWAMPLVWIGMNPITLYLAENVVPWNALAERFVGGPIKGALGAGGELLVAGVALAFVIALARFLFQRKIFLRI